MLEQKNLRESLLACSILVQKRMHDLLPENFSASKIVEAMRYSCMSEGKRIRPFLVIASAKIFGYGVLQSLNCATAIELIHNYSLIHDDLPAMDNDDFRRGQPSAHKQFDEATAILAGDGLLTFAFELLAQVQTHRDPVVRCELIKTIAKASGHMGMVGGQMIDIEKTNKKISKEELANIHRLKTGELFMASAESGAILGRASIDERKALRFFANDLGLAFQIRDDILDHNGINVGKINLDEINHKKNKTRVSFVDIVGLDHSNKQLEILRQQAIDHLTIFGNKANLLIDLTNFVISRSS